MLFSLLVCAAALSLGAASPIDYVLNGKIATQGQFPFAGWLGTCTSSILDKRTILTAGHCVCRTKPTSVLLGAVKGRQPEEGSKRYTLDTSRQVIHPNYRTCGTIGKDDMAILKTTEDIVFTEYIKPIKLHDTETSAGDDVTVSGWGQDENRQSGTLKFATNTVRDCRRFVGAVCQLMTPNSPYYGDSGGPLFVGTAGNYEQVGTVSGGDFTNNQAIYGNVFNNREWIRGNME